MSTLKTPKSVPTQLKSQARLAFKEPYLLRPTSFPQGRKPRSVQSQVAFINSIKQVASSPPSTDLCLPPLQTREQSRLSPVKFPQYVEFSQASKFPQPVKSPQTFRPSIVASIFPMSFESIYSDRRVSNSIARYSDHQYEHIPGVSFVIEEAGKLLPSNMSYTTAPPVVDIIYPDNVRPLSTREKVGNLVATEQLGFYFDDCFGVVVQPEVRLPGDGFRSLVIMIHESAEKASVSSGDTEFAGLTCVRIISSVELTTTSMTYNSLRHSVPYDAQASR
ncbi:hypothetical protein B0H16DRAFT_1466154 [Mycena metata]|uniref:Uncharacterized protein n=1 Tax=Mycena metata TaxID=1033252 RepID=A0AAD7I8M4_9AGAR|nr:hypothetical protein B0H16DRAFT_1466154 [Mycena metata]